MTSIDRALNSIFSATATQQRLRSIFTAYPPTMIGTKRLYHTAVMANNLSVCCHDLKYLTGLENRGGLDYVLWMLTRTQNSLSPVLLFLVRILPMVPSPRARHSPFWSACWIKVFVFILRLYKKKVIIRT